MVIAPVVGDAGAQPGIGRELDRVVPGDRVRGDAPARRCVHENRFISPVDAQQPPVRGEPRSGAGVAREVGERVDEGAGPGVPKPQAVADRVSAGDDPEPVGANVDMPCVAVRAEPPPAQGAGQVEHDGPVPLFAHGHEPTVPVQPEVIARTALVEQLGRTDALGAVRRSTDRPAHRPGLGRDQGVPVIEHRLFQDGPARRHRPQVGAARERPDAEPGDGRGRDVGPVAVDGHAAVPGRFDEGLCHQGTPIARGELEDSRLAVPHLRGEPAAVAVEAELLAPAREQAQELAPVRVSQSRRTEAQPRLTSNSPPGWNAITRPL